MKLCPYCKQDYLWWINIGDFVHHAVWCPECDTLWRNADEVTAGVGHDIETFVAALGKNLDWKDIDRLATFGD